MFLFLKYGNNNFVTLIQNRNIPIYILYENN